MAGAAERVFPGEVASPGLVAGVLHVQRRRGAGGRRKGSPAAERAALEVAIAHAGLPVDPDVERLAFEAVASGARADIAWVHAVDARIVEHEAGEGGEDVAAAAVLAHLRERVLEQLGGVGDPAAWHEVPDRAIVVAPDLNASRFLELDWRRVRAVALLGGSVRDHVAVLARARGVPLLVGLRVDLEQVQSGAPAILDAEAGRLVEEPSAETAEAYERRLEEAEVRRETEALTAAGPARSADGTLVTVYLNVDDPGLLSGLDPEHVDGIGLVRTEFLFPAGGPLPDEARQYEVYARIVEWAAGRPVTVRTLDAGSDKPILGLTPPLERNPALGLRGIRLSLARPDVFRVQLRALARAAAQGRLRVMLPMVTLPRELAEARALLDAEVAALRAAGVAALRPPLGIMVEVPAAALNVAAFDAEFLSLGTNDLLQYTMAASRDAADVAALQNAADPALLELVARVVRHGALAGLEVSVCGEMAGEPRYLPALLDAGVRVLSVPPARLGATKAAVARWSPARHVR